MKRWAFLLVMLAIWPATGMADPAPDLLGQGALSLIDSAQDPVAASGALRMLVIITALTFMPAALIVMTPFTRFIIVFSLLRNALGLQQAPPNQVLVGLSLFLSLAVMQPTLQQVNEVSITPYLAGEMKTIDAIQEGLGPMRNFMIANTRKSDMSAVMEIGKIPRPTIEEGLDSIPTPTVVCAFVLSELKTAFTIAVLVYLPFLVIDMVIASLLLGMGMMMLPPVIISLPFKLLLFVLMDGWVLLVRSMTAGFGGV